MENQLNKKILCSHKIDIYSTEYLKNNYLNTTSNTEKWRIECLNRIIKTNQAFLEIQQEFNEFENN